MHGHRFILHVGRLLFQHRRPIALCQQITTVQRRFSIQKPMMSERQKLIIDCDTGVDDAQALIMGLMSNAEVLAITCVAGNTTCDQVVTNTLRVLQACDRSDVPVHQGARKALVGVEGDSVDHYGEDGLGNRPDPTPPSHEPLHPEQAAIAMVKLVNKYPGKITLVTLAPLTNVALAIRLDPDFGSKLKKTVIMGGNIKGRGRMTPSAEFNFYMDPEAALVVLSDLKCPITMLTYEISRDCGLPWEWFDELLAIDTKKGRFHKRIHECKHKEHKEVKKLPAYVSCDPIAMAIALDESVILSSEKHYCAVELQGQLTRGQMVVDWKGQLKKEPNADIVMEVDLEKLRTLYEKMLK